MKLKVVVVDLELTRRQKRLAGAGVALTVALTAGVALAAPKTFVAGQTLKAAELNANFNELDARASATDATVLDLAARVAELEAAPLTTSALLTVIGDWPGKAECVSQTGGFVQGACPRMAQSYCIDQGYLAGWFEGDLAPPPVFTDPAVVCIK
jgi:hypothetical protein